jgi:hypothetical protein
MAASSDDVATLLRKSRRSIVDAEKIVGNRRRTGAGALRRIVAEAVR